MIISDERTVYDLSKNYRYSFIATLAYERSKNFFPQDYHPNHSALISANGIGLPDSVSGIALGPMAGIDLLYKFEGNYFVRGKFAGGAAYRFRNRIQKRSGEFNVSKLEALIDIDFTLGYLFTKRQEIILNADIAATNTYGGDVLLDNTINQFSVLYMYFF